MISLQQMRAARGLLQWSQSDLARECGISVTAMNSIDRGLAAPRTKTLNKMQEVFERHGVEFTEGHGVRMRGDVFKVITYEGKDAFSRYLKDVVETLKIYGGEGLHIFESDDVFIKTPAGRRSLFEYYLDFKKYGLSEKILVKEGTTRRYGPASCSTYRWCSPELARQIGHSVYGNKYCIFFAERIVVIENPDVADAYRRQFNENWKQAKKMPASTSLYEEDLKRFSKNT